jgi:hypothetical protein
MKRDQGAIASVWLPPMKHKLSEDTCNVNHLVRGQCRFCSQCIQWIPSFNFDAECNPASHKEHDDDKDQMQGSPPV